MPRSPTSRHFRSGSLRLHYLDWGGAGAPAVLLHGGSAHAHWWDFVASELTADLHPYALDLRGHGESDWSSDGAYALEDYASDLDGLFAAAAIERPVLIGHSLGSFVAAHYAVANPRGLSALVMVDGRPWFGESGARYIQLLGMFPAAEHETLEEAVLNFQPLPRDHAAAPEVLAHVARRGFREQQPGSWTGKFDRRALASLRPFDLRDRLGDIECPVLFVRGEKSPIVSPATAAKLAKSCRTGTWVEVSGAYHHVLLDRPVELAREIRRFLTSFGVTAKPGGGVYP